MNTLQNLHTHTTYCDGKDTVEEMINAALEKGFGGIGFSGHSYMFYSPSHSMSLEGTEKYREEVKDMKEKYRGKIDKSVSDYIRGRLEGRDDIVLDRIFVTHSQVPAETLEAAVALVKELHPFTEVIVTVAGCTITSHCGKSCLGVLFFKK